jgi:hypothetical protein
MSCSINKMSSARFLVAKYIPDMHRLEPRNIGVVVWNKGQISARFIGEVASGDDHVIVPRRLGIRSKNVYQQWIHYWREQMAQRTLSVNGNGECVSRNSPEFLEALKRKSKQQYLLVDGGFISGDVDISDIDDVVRDLFEALVDDRSEKQGSQEEESVLLKKAIANALRESGIDGMKGYQSRIPLTFRVDSHPLSFTFDYGIYTNRPKVLFQHVALTRPTTVNSAAFMFDCLRKSAYEPYRLPKQRCFSLVRASQQTMETPNAENELNKLKVYSEVLDLFQGDQALDTLRSVVASL